MSYYTEKKIPNKYWHYELKKMKQFDSHSKNVTVHCL